MLVKCPKCKSEISADAQVNWKCASCKKVFKVSFSRLETVLERKQKGSNVSLIKCPSCGRDLDNGNEEISWSCLECGNRVTGDLMTFKERMKKSKQADTKYETQSERGTIGKALKTTGKVILGLSGMVFLGSIEEGSGIAAIIAVSMASSGLCVLGFAEVIQLLEDIRNKLYS